MAHARMTIHQIKSMVLSFACPNAGTLSRLAPWTPPWPIATSCQNGTVSNQKRVVRGVAVASFSTGVALLFHLIGGGAMPAAMGLIAPLILSAFVGMLVMSARPRLLPTVAVTAVAQIAFHTLFTVGSGVSAVGSQAAHAGHAGHTMTTPIAGAAPMAGATTEASSAVVGLQGDGRMWLMHAVAAVITAVVLHRGELIIAGLARLLERVVALVAPPTPTTHPLSERPRSWVDSVPRARAARLLIHVAPDRGPPLFLAA